MRNRQQVRADAAQVAIERRHLRLRGGARRGHGDRQNRVRAQLGLVGRSVQLDHLAIDVGLLFRFHAGYGRSNLLVDILNGLARSFAQVALGIAVAQLHRFMLAGGSARGYRGAAHGAIREMHVGFDGGIAARIQNLAANDFDDFHMFLFQHIWPRMNTDEHGAKRGQKMVRAALPRILRFAKSRRAAGAWASG